MGAPHNAGPVLAMAIGIVRAQAAAQPATAAAALAQLGQVYAKLAALAADARDRDAARGRRLVCLEDGLGASQLRRHLRAAHGMTPDEYRAKWGLGADAPMVAPGYRETKAAALRGAAKKTRRRLAVRTPVAAIKRQTEGAG